MAKKGKKRREAERRAQERASDAAHAPGDEAAGLARAKAKAEHEAERLRRKAKREHAEGLNPLVLIVPVGGALVAGVVLLVVALSGGGGGEAEPSPTSDPRLGGATPAATFGIEAAGEESPSAIFIPDTLTIPAGEVVEIVVTNTAPKASHNLRVSGDDGEYQVDDPANPKDDWFLPLVEAGKTGRLQLKMDTPGSYKFQCDLHPQSQKGTLIVQ